MNNAIWMLLFPITETIVMWFEFKRGRHKDVKDGLFGLVGLIYTAIWIYVGTLLKG
jgi:hypothetical protein